MKRAESLLWARVQAATLKLGLPKESFTRRVLSVFMECESLDELRAELGFVDNPDVLAWYRALGVDV
jgi:hypothetical protein